MTPKLRKTSQLAILVALAVSALANAASEGGYFAVIVSDIDASAKWYRSTFGLAPVSSLTDAGRFEIVNLSKPGMFVELLQLDAAARRPASRIEGLFKAGILVDDLVAFIDDLPLTQEKPEVIVDERNKLRLIQLRDPDGNAIQVMELWDDSTR